MDNKPPVQPSTPENPGHIEAAGLVPAVESAPVAPANTPSAPAPAPIVPATPATVAPAAPVANTAATPTVTSPVIADDVDVIEKEWVDAAQQIVEATAADPYQEEEAVENLQVDYLKKRYGKDIKKS
jgi:hypothetical protein